MHQFESGISNYSLASIVGQCYDEAGVVNLAKHLKTGKMVALKRINIDKVKEEINLLQHEIILTRQLNHPNVLRYFVSFVYGSEVCIVSSLMAYGSCRDLLNSHFVEGLPENAIVLILRDILDALDYIHRKGYIHRAIRASHVLISAAGTACLSGLKYACEIVQNGKWQRQIHSFPPSTVKNLNWLSPEVLEQNMQGYNEKSDMYSIGMVICEFANGAEPFAGVPTTLMLTEKVRGCAPQLLDCTTLPTNETANDQGDCEVDEHYRNQIDRRFSEGLHEVAGLCLQKDPLHRPNAAQLLTHPFLKGSRKGLFLPDLLKPVVPLGDRVALNKDELANFDNVQKLSEMELGSCEWEF